MLKRMIYHRVVMVVLTCLASSAEPLKIGMVATLTGPAAEYDRYETQGAKLATEEVNKAGGVRDIVKSCVSETGASSLNSPVRQLVRFVLLHRQI